MGVVAENEIQLFFFLKMLVNCLIHLFDGRILQCFQCGMLAVVLCWLFLVCTIFLRVFLKVVTVKCWGYWQKYAVHATESEVSCPFLSSAALKEDEEGWGRGFGAVSGVSGV